MLYSVLNRILAPCSSVGGRPASLGLLGQALCTLLFLVDICQAQSLVVTPSSLSFSQRVDLAEPPAQTVQVTASDGSHIPFTVRLPDGVSGNVAIGLAANPTSG